MENQSETKNIDSDNEALPKTSESAKKRQPNNAESGLKLSKRAKTQTSKVPSSSSKSQTENASNEIAEDLTKSKRYGGAQKVDKSNHAQVPDEEDAENTEAAVEKTSPQKSEPETAADAEIAENLTKEHKSFLGMTYFVRRGLVQSKGFLDSTIYTATPEDDDENNEPPYDPSAYPQAASSASTSAAAHSATEAWMKEYGYSQGWPQEYRDMYNNLGYNDLARQWSAWGHSGYPYPISQNPHFAQFGHHAYYGQYGQEGWQQYQAAAAASLQLNANINRQRKRHLKTADDHDDYDEDVSLDADTRRKMRKTRPNFSKDVIALLTNWILTNFENPYPQKDVKTRMQEQTGLSELQLDNWFSNARRRLLVKDEATKRYSILNRTPKKRGPKSKRDGDSDTEEMDG
ncbi:hypothetical protein HK096_007181, partial [Nowakowskiella sp. JEL0078]